MGCPEVPITPEVFDEWVDVNNDAQFDPEIDTWSDGNGNQQIRSGLDHEFQSRAAQGVKDDLMAVSVVIDDGNTHGIVAVDTIGLMRKFVLDVRRSLPAEWGIDYLLVHTHNHEGPDTQGLWGPGYLAAV